MMMSVAAQSRQIRRWWLEWGAGATGISYS